MMARLTLILFVAGLYLIGSGCYDLSVQAGPSRQPTTVSVAELEKNMPPDRHLIVTGGRAVTAAAVKFYKNKWGTKVSGSEVLFIPFAGAASTVPNGGTPSILLRVNEDELNAAKAAKNMNFRALEGVRTTSMDLESKAQQRLVEMYGQAAVDRMIILDYHGHVGMGAGLGKLAGGILVAGAILVIFIYGRKPKATPPPIPSSGPPPIPR